MATEIWDDIEESELADDGATFEHGFLDIRIGSLLVNFIEGKNLGAVVDSTVEYRFLQRPPGSTKTRQPYKQPDVSFLSQARVPRRFNSYPEIAPDLAVEILSPTDRAYDIEDKGRIYQQAGVKAVWVVYPNVRRISVYRLENGLDPQSYSGDQTLDGGSVLPDLPIKVSDIFNYPPDPADAELNAE
jgi:Uma2 family endonuclease